MLINDGNNHTNESRFVNQVCTNTKSDLIEITEDKLENILLKFFNDYKKMRGWLTSFTIFLTLLVTILTANFKEFMGINKDVWTAIFYISLALSCIWMIIGIVFAIKNYKRTRLNCLIDKIKNNRSI